MDRWWHVSDPVARRFKKPVTIKACTMPKPQQAEKCILIAEIPASQDQRNSSAMYMYSVEKGTIQSKGDIYITVSTPSSSSHALITVENTKLFEALSKQ